MTSAAEPDVTSYRVTRKWRIRWPPCHGGAVQSLRWRLAGTNLGAPDLPVDQHYTGAEAERLPCAARTRGLPSLVAVSRVRIAVLSDASAPSLVLSMVPAFARAAGIAAEDEQRLAAVVGQLVSFTLDNAYPDDDLGEIEVTLEAGDGSVQVAVHDWGLPLTSAGGGFGPLPEGLAALPRDARDVLLTNLGANGKRLTASVTIRSGGDGSARWHHIEAAPRRAPTGADASDAIEVRAATPQDAEAIAQLLYESYHLSYVHADFYRPQYLMEVLASGGLLSTIAVHD